MHTDSVIMILVIGALAGWLAGNIMKGRGFGVVGNIILGILGAAIGSLLFSFLGIYTSGIIGSLITATVGAVALLFIISLIKNA